MARRHRQGWDTARAPGIPWAWPSPTPCRLQTLSANRDHARQPGTPRPHGLPTVPSGPTDLSPLLCPGVLAGAGSGSAVGRGGLGSAWPCQCCRTVPAAARQRPWGRRREASGAEQGGGGRWLPAALPVPGIRRWLRAPRARHSLLARPRDAGKQRGKLSPLSRGKEEEMGNLPGHSPRHGGN